MHEMTAPALSLGCSALYRNILQLLANTSNIPNELAELRDATPANSVCSIRIQCTALMRLPRLRLHPQAACSAQFLGIPSIYRKTARGPNMDSRRCSVSGSPR
jgi:hypothetical protein